MRVVLTWGAQPSDLDAYMEDSQNNTNFHGKPQVGNMVLEKDEESGFGPEVTKVSNLDNQTTYMYYVKNYSRTSFGSLEKVEIYYGNGILKTINITGAAGDKAHDYWKVFTVTGNGSLTANDIIVHNELMNTKPVMLP